MPSEEIGLNWAALPELHDPVVDDKIAAISIFLAELRHKAAVYDAIKRRYAALYEKDWDQITIPPLIQEFLSVVGQCVDE